MKTSEQISAELELINLELIEAITSIMKEKQTFILDECLLESDKGFVSLSITDQSPLESPMIIVENINDGEESEMCLSDLSIMDLCYILEQLEN